jgi:hypothetical protein
MKNSCRFFVGFSLLVLIAFYGCGGGKPEAEIQAAQQAMDKAKSFHAEELAASNWNEAMQAFIQGEAAVKEGKPSKTYFLRAKSRFEKTAAIAKAHQDDLAKEVSEMQMTTAERFSKVKAAIAKGGVKPKVLKQVNPIVAEAEAGTASVASLVSQGDFLKARTTAKEVQKKVYNAELILAGKKPIY